MDVHPPKNGMYRYWSIAICHWGKTTDKVAVDWDGKLWVVCGNLSLVDSSRVCPAARWMDPCCSTDPSHCSQVPLEPSRFRRFFRRFWSRYWTLWDQQTTGLKRGSDDAARDAEKQHHCIFVGSGVANFCGCKVLPDKLEAIYVGRCWPFGSRQGP